MNSIINVSFNVSFIFKSLQISEVFDLVKGIYESSGDSSLSEFKTYSDYVKYHKDRLRLEKVNNNGVVKAAPFTLVDIESKDKIALIHYGSYEDTNEFNALQFSPFQTDSLIEIVACLNPDNTDEDLKRITIDSAKKDIGGNIILLTDNKLIPDVIFNKIYEKSVNHFNSFKQVVG